MDIVLFNKESSVTTSSVYIAYQILKFFEKRKTDRLSMFKLVSLIKEVNLEANPKQLMFGLMFLNISGIIEIDGSFIVVKNRNV